MGFDKNKVMRNAERYLAQGKISAAINQYKKVLKNDPSDVNTQNMLGDLFSKAKDKEAAVKYYELVADHYNTQGFAKKAIAVYNKIYRLTPDNPNVSENLAELYQKRGSLKEARKHFEILANYYEEEEKTKDALSVWEKIAQIDPDNKKIYLKIADFYLRDDQNDKAVNAFVEGANRLIECDSLDEAVAVYTQALDIEPAHPGAVKGFVKTQISLGYPEEGVKILHEVFEKDPDNKDVVFLLVDCYLEIDEPKNAEEILVDFVGKERGEYPKLLDLVDYYVNIDDFDSSVRTLSMIVEQLLVSQKPKRLLNILHEILARDPEHLGALRLQVRYFTWHKDNSELESTLHQMAEASKLNDSTEDERFALSQLIMLNPDDSEVSARLKELIEEHGTEQYSESEYAEDLVPVGVAVLGSDETLKNEHEYQLNGNSSALNGSASNSFVESTVLEATEYKDSSQNGNEAPDSLTEEGIEEQINGIRFYIEEGYADLAQETFDDLQLKCGSREEFVEIRKMLEEMSEGNSDVVDVVATDIQEDEEIIDANTDREESELEGNADEDSNQLAVEDDDELLLELTNQDQVDEVVDQLLGEGDLDLEITDDEVKLESKPSTEENDFDDPDIEIEQSSTDSVGSEKTDEENLFEEDDSDYETHYHPAVAYQEMGLLDDAVTGFQNALDSTKPNDGSGRFLQCCILLGHCSVEKQDFESAANWFNRAFEVDNLGEDEKHALNYELANVFELDGDEEKAKKQFEEIHAIDSDYRDVSDRLEKYG